jgi:hypothetical protein
VFARIVPLGANATRATLFADREAVMTRTGNLQIRCAASMAVGSGDCGDLAAQYGDSGYYDHFSRIQTL